MGVPYGSGMGQMGEDQRATPDVAEPVKSRRRRRLPPTTARPRSHSSPWRASLKAVGRSHLAAAARVEAKSPTVARFLGMHRGSQAARRSARALARLTSHPLAA